jgi:hypothetical protein
VIRVGQRKSVRTRLANLRGLQLRESGPGPFASFYAFFLEPVFFPEGPDMGFKLCAQEVQGGHLAFSPGDNGHGYGQHSTLGQRGSV